MLQYTEGWAVTSLVCGLVTLCVICSNILRVEEPLLHWSVVQWYCVMLQYTEGWAVTSLVCGLVTLCVICSNILRVEEPLLHWSVVQRHCVMLQYTEGWGAVTSLVWGLVTLCYAPIQWGLRSRYFFGLGFSDTVLCSNILRVEEPLLHWSVV